MARAVNLNTEISHGEEVVADLHERVDTIATALNQDLSLDQVANGDQTIQTAGHI